MEVQNWPIGRIIVRDRARTGVGDLEGLKASITAVGQLQPIAAEPDGTLLFGERRLAAMRELGETTIAVNVIADLDDLHRLLIERDENTERKEMSPAEKTRMFDRIEAAQKRLTPRGGAARKAANESEESSPSSPSKETRSSRDKAAKAAGISHDSARKVREIRAAAADETQPAEVREEAARQYEGLKQPGAAVDPAHKAVKQAQARAERKPILKAGLGEGQAAARPDPKPLATLTRRLTDGINKGQELEKLAAEIEDQDLPDLSIATLYALRNRMTLEIRVRTVMKDALNRQIEKRGYDKRKITVNE